MLLSMSSWFSASAVVAQLTGEWSLSRNQASFLTIAVQLGFVVGALSSAMLNLADVVDPSRLISLGALGASMANIGLIFANGAVVAIVLRVLTGACLAVVYPTGLKASATWYPSRRGAALGVLVGALTLGSALPHLANGFGGARWRAVIVITTVATLIGAVIVRWFYRDGPHPFPRATFEPQRVSRVVANGAFRWASFSYFAHMWELYAMWSWIGAFYAETLRSRNDVPRAAALLTFATIGLGAAGCVVAGIVADRGRRTRVLFVATTTSGSCALLVGLLQHSPVPVLAVVGLVWGLTVVCDSAQYSAIVSEVTDQSSVGTALTLQLASGFALTAVTIWLIPAVERQHGWAWAFGILAVGSAVGAGAILRLHRLLPRHTAPTPAPAWGTRPSSA
jgi:MFS family permease